jgi:hypothetical protein
MSEIMLHAERPQYPPRVVIYGPPGIGKTTVASLAPGVCFIPTERGLADISVPVLAPESGVISTWGELHAAIDAAEQSEFATVVIDTITAAQNLLFAEVADEDRVPSIADIPYGKGYPRALPRWIAMLHRLTDLQQQGRQVIALGHSQVEPFGDPEGENYDRYTLRLHQQAEGKPSIRAETIEWADIVAFASLRSMRKVIGKGSFDEKSIATGKDRVLYFGQSLTRVSKDRYGLPDSCPLQWDAFSASLAKVRTPF